MDDLVRRMQTPQEHSNTVVGLCGGLHQSPINEILGIKDGNAPMTYNNATPIVCVCVCVQLVQTWCVLIEFKAFVLLSFCFIVVHRGGQYVDQL